MNKSLEILLQLDGFALLGKGLELAGPYLDRLGVMVLAGYDSKLVFSITAPDAAAALAVSAFNTRNPMNGTMKTMMDLVISLQQFDEHLRTLNQRRQLSAREEQAALRHLHLVREIIPPEVLVHYDQMKTTASDLLENQELFAMAVLVATYGSLSPRKRKKFVNHFDPPPRPRSSSWRKSFLKATRRQLVARN